MTVDIMRDMLTLVMCKIEFMESPQYQISGD